jgi:hypothetical protein
MKKILKDLLDTILAIIAVCAIVTPFLILASL